MMNFDDGDRSHELTPGEVRQMRAHDRNATWHAEKVRVAGRAFLLLALRGGAVTTDDVRTAIGLDDKCKSKWLGTMVARFVRTRVVAVDSYRPSTRKSRNAGRIAACVIHPDGGEGRAWTWLHRHPARPTDPPAAQWPRPVAPASAASAKPVVDLQPAAAVTFPPDSSIGSELLLWPGDERKVADAGTPAGAESRGGCQSAEQRDRS